MTYKSKLLQRSKPRRIPCDCECCRKWRAFCTRVKRFNMSATAPWVKQVIELNRMMRDKSDSEE